MKRIVKFRGKSKRTDEWLYGDLIRNTEGAFAVVPPFDGYEPQNGWLYEVEEETIGQFTGLLDEDNNEIYEGDVVDWTFFYNRDYGGGATECDTQVRGVIEWKQGGFILRVIKNDFEEAGSYGISDLNTDTESDVEVLGNIHDNKDLLEQNN